MSYLDDLLGEGETIIFGTRQHGFILFARIVGELILLVLLAAIAFAAIQAFVPPQYGQYVAVGAGVLALFVVLSMLKDYLRWNNDQFIITDRRVLQLKGVFNKSVLDSSLEKINDVQMQQSMLGRMFDYGTIDILTASEEAINRMSNIASPLEFKRAMQDARARYDGYLRTPAQSINQPRSDLQSVMEQLASLRDRGILSEAEFEAKKREVLSRV
jgi:uncharacterized membrane protein YdbT with pleckstrin-like domain